MENIRGRFRENVGKVVLIVLYVNKLLISYFEHILRNIRPFLKKKVLHNLNEITTFFLVLNLITIFLQITVIFSTHFEKKQLTRLRQWLIA